MIITLVVNPQSNVEGHPLGIKWALQVGQQTLTEPPEKDPDLTITASIRKVDEADEVVVVTNLPVAGEDDIKTVDHSAVVEDEVVDALEVDTSSTAVVIGIETTTTILDVTTTMYLGLLRVTM